MEIIGVAQFSHQNSSMKKGVKGEIPRKNLQYKKVKQ
jgi:hypothetical protein